MSKKEQGRPRGRLLTAAVAALLLAAVAYMLWPAEPASLMANHYEPYPMYLNTHLGDNPPNELLETATGHYQSGNYAAALPAFQEIIVSTVHNGPFHFYAGICQLELGHPLEASIHLEEAVDREDAQFVQPAKWYLALAYLQQERKKETARYLLEKIARGEGDYSERAQKLLSAVE